MEFAARKRFHERAKDAKAGDGRNPCRCCGLVGELLKGRGKWDEVDDNGTVALVIPAADVVKLMKAYEEVQEALDEIEEREDGEK